MKAHIHKALCIRFSCLTWQILTVFVGIGFIFWFSDVTIQASTEFTEEPMLRLETGQHTAMVRRISVDAQQRFLVSGSEDKTARVYDIKTGRLLQILRIPVEGTNVGKIYAVAISPDGSTVAISGWTGKKAGVRFGHQVWGQGLGSGVRFGFGVSLWVWGHTLTGCPRMRLANESKRHSKLCVN